MSGVLLSHRSSITCSIMKHATPAREIVAPYTFVRSVVAVTLPLQLAACGVFCSLGSLKQSDAIKALPIPKSNFCAAPNLRLAAVYARFHRLNAYPPI